jgi:hypothetical protein
VIALEVSLDKLNALGKEAAVIACSAPADEKIQMRLATGLILQLDSYVEELITSLTG